MQDFLKVTGMVIKTFPQGEYDRRITLLTKDQGKITAFVKGARRQGSRFCASSDLFVFGNFDLYVGKDSYTVQNADIMNYFEFTRSDMEAAYYGMYFLELADYYGAEGNEEALLLLLVYRALQGLKTSSIPNRLVRIIFELKLFIIEGEFIPIDRIASFSDDIYQLIDYYEKCSIEKLYGLSLKDEQIDELERIAIFQRKHLVDKKLNSLEMLEMMI